jgi:hypothetical protein
MKSTTIVPITIALLQPHLIVSKGIKVGGRKTRVKRISQQAISQQQQEERDLYTTETININQPGCCTANVPAVVEIDYTYSDDEYAGTNKTVSPMVAPRPTPFPTEQYTEHPTLHPVDIATLAPTSIGITTPSPTPDLVTPAPTSIEIITPTPTSIGIVTPSPTPNPSPYTDDGGLSDDIYIATPNPTLMPSGKPSKSHGYLPTSYHPTDAVDDWASGWMPSAPSQDDDGPLLADDDDTDDWKGGYPVDHPVESKAGKSHKSGKSGKSSKSGGSGVTDDDYRGYGLSKVSSLLSSEVSSASFAGNVGAVAVVSGLIISLYL